MVGEGLLPFQTGKIRRVQVTKVSIESPSVSAPPQSHPRRPHRHGRPSAAATRSWCRACVHEDRRRRATVAQVEHLRPPGPAWCGLPWIAAPTPGLGGDPQAAPRPIFRSICRRTTGWPREVAPWVDKIRYNPGHLYHHERNLPWQDKVRFLVDAGREARLRLSGGRELRIGRSGPAREICGRRLAQSMLARHWSIAIVGPAGLHAVLCFAEGLRSGGSGGSQSPFRRRAARRAAALGCDRGGHAARGNSQDPRGARQLLARGIGDTIRVSLTVPLPGSRRRSRPERRSWPTRRRESFSARWRKSRAFEHHQLSELFPRGKRSLHRTGPAGSASSRVRRRLSDHDRGDGLPREWAGRNRHADLGLWCGPTTVNLKRGDTRLGAFSYTEILPRLEEELHRLVKSKAEERPSPNVESQMSKE